MCAPSSLRGESGVSTPEGRGARPATLAAPRMRTVTVETGNPRPAGRGSPQAGLCPLPSAGVQAQHHSSHPGQSGGGESNVGLTGLKWVAPGLARLQARATARSQPWPASGDAALGATWPRPPNTGQRPVSSNSPCLWPSCLPLIGTLRDCGEDPLKPSGMVLTRAPLPSSSAPGATCSRSGDWCAVPVRVLQGDHQQDVCLPVYLSIYPSTILQGIGSHDSRGCQVPRTPSHRAGAPGEPALQFRSEGWEKPSGRSSLLLRGGRLLT